MSILCAIFGHKPPKDRSEHARLGGGDYLSLEHPYRDNIGRVHLYVFGSCPRCGERYQVGMVHLSQAGQFMHLDEVKK